MANPIHIVRQRMTVTTFPALTAPHSENDTVVKGDLHGNPINLLHFLFQEGILDVDANSKTIYNEIVKCYQAININDYETLTPEEKAENLRFKNEINRLFQKLELSEDAPSFILIGDIFADRGKDDSIMMNLLRRLDAIKARFKFPSSNHDAWLMDYYQKGGKTYDLNCAEGLIAQGGSLIRFHETRHETGYDDKTFNEFIENIYLPRLKLIDYDFVEDGIVIYTHAGIPDENLQDIARYLNVLYTDKTAQDLAITIDEINERFIGKIKHDKKLFADLGEDPEHPLHNIHWYRHKVAKLTRESKPNYRRYSIHGHDVVTTYTTDSHSVDSNFAKHPLGNYDTGDYISATVRPLVPSLKLQPPKKDSAEDPTHAEITQLPKNVQPPVNTQQPVSIKAPAGIQPPANTQPPAINRPQERHVDRRSNRTHPIFNTENIVKQPNKRQEFKPAPELQKPAAPALVSSKPSEPAPTAPKQDAYLFSTSSVLGVLLGLIAATATLLLGGSALWALGAFISSVLSTKALAWTLNSSPEAPPATPTPSEQAAASPERTNNALLKSKAVLPIAKKGSRRATVDHHEVIPNNVKTPGLKPRLRTH